MILLLIACHHLLTAFAVVRVRWRRAPVFVTSVRSLTAS